MVSPENSNWLFDYPLIDDIPVADGSFTVSASAFSWPPPPSNFRSRSPLLTSLFVILSDSSVEIDASLADSHALNDSALKKRGRSDSCTASSSKACREKLRRDKLNDKFVELGSILEPGRPPKTDKAAILIDAVRMVTQLRDEAQKLKDTNTSLQEKIKELKAEKNELRDEKQRLKTEKEKLELQVKSMNAQPAFLPPPPAIPAAFAPQGQAPGNKLVPFISYPGVAMWQFMPPAAVDTSQDHVLRPPVA
ncbi:Transcription factor ILR3, partial [Mucuna pruriens]